MVVLALVIGFLLGILLMVLLVSGREEEDRAERLEREESRRTDASRDPSLRP